MSAGIFGVRRRRPRANKPQWNFLERAHGETAELAVTVIVFSPTLQNTRESGDYATKPRIPRLTRTSGST
jgi:hypothetical protein